MRPSVRQIVVMRRPSVVVVPPGTTAALKFNLASNSQYVPLVRAR